LSVIASRIWQGDDRLTVKVGRGIDEVDESTEATEEDASETASWTSSFTSATTTAARAAAKRRLRIVDKRQNNPQCTHKETTGKIKEGKLAMGSGKER
jgi:hypothetical protein